MTRVAGVNTVYALSVLLNKSIDLASAHILSLIFLEFVEKLILGPANTNSGIHYGAFDPQIVPRNKECNLNFHRNDYETTAFPVVL